MLHSALTKIHILENWTYANAAARTGATGFVAGDVGKIAYQQDTGQYWRLTATTPTWVMIMGAVGYPSAAGAAGNVLRSDGTNFVSAQLNTADLTPMAMSYIAKLIGVNLNSANTDNAMSVPLPVGFTRWKVNATFVSHASVSLTTATLGVFTATGGGGQVIAANQSLAALTSTAENTNNNFLGLAGTNVATESYNVGTIYFRVGTAQGSAATADCILSYSIIP
jgi:hypothetical protein